MYILLIRIFRHFTHFSMQMIIFSQSTQRVVVGATEKQLSNGKVGISNDEIILTLNLPSFLNFVFGTVHYHFRQIKMKLEVDHLTV